MQRSDYWIVHSQTLKLSKANSLSSAVGRPRIPNTPAPWSVSFAGSYRRATKKWHPLAEKFYGWSPYVYALDNPINFIDEDGREAKPPTIKQIYDHGYAKSSTFRKLLTDAGVTAKNLSSIVKYGKGTATNFKSGNITLKKGESLDQLVVNLSHELTNKKNMKAGAKLADEVAEGKIIPKEYALSTVKLESEGMGNQVLVASELGMKKMDGELQTQLLTDYNSGEISAETVYKVSEIYAPNSIIQDTGEKAIDYYTRQGQKLYKAHQEEQRLLKKKEEIEKKLQEIEKKLSNSKN